MTHVSNIGTMSGHNSRRLSKSRAGSYLALVPSSTRYLDEHPWVARTLSHYTSVKRGKVSSNSATVETTKFARPYKSRMRQYIINLVHQGHTIGPQPTQMGATTFGAPNMKTDHSQPSHPVFSTFS
jgi:hypothetical protein